MKRLMMFFVAMLTGISLLGCGTTAKNIQGDAVAYVTQHGGYTQNVLGASIFDSGAFLPTSLFGWLLLLILILALVLLGNTLYGRMSVRRI